MSRGAGERGSRGANAFVLLTALVLAGCMLAPEVTRGPEAPEDWILEDTAPTSVITAPARTARPTRAAPTATGTIAPTPTIIPGVYLFDVLNGAGTGGDCEQAILNLTSTPAAYATAPLATRISGSGLTPQAYTVEVCNMTGAPVTFDVRQEVYYRAFSTSANSLHRCAYDCTPDFATTVLTVDDDPLCIVPPDTPIGTIVDAVMTHRRVLHPWIETPEANVYYFTGASVGAYGACDLPPLAWSEYEFAYVWDPNPGGNATPTRDATRDAWITEVLARPEGATCGDWNLRGGCGWNDQFVEVGVPSAMSLAGYRIEILNADDVVTCDYEIASDNLTEPLKAFWQDYMDSGVTAPTETPTGTITPTTTPTATPTGTLTPVPTVTPAPDNCGPWPVTGYAKLYNASGSLIDTRAYDYSGGGQYGDSWAATDWTNPGGQWWWYSPSPGRGNRIPPTATPTPATPTVTPEPTWTP